MLTRKFFGSRGALAFLVGCARAGYGTAPNLFWATPLSGTGYLTLRAIGVADLSGTTSNIAADTLLGNPTSSASAAQPITILSALVFSGTTLGLGIAPVRNGGTGVVTFTSNLPLIGYGTGNVAQGTRSGNTTEFLTFSGAATASKCLHTDASGNAVVTAADCTGSPAVGTAGTASPANPGGMGADKMVGLAGLIIINGQMVNTTQGDGCFAGIKTEPEQRHPRGGTVWKQPGAIRIEPQFRDGHHGDLPVLGRGRRYGANIEHGLLDRPRGGPLTGCTCTLASLTIPAMEQ